MNVLILVESCFGRTAEIADAVASGLRSAGASATVAAAAEASGIEGYDLLCVGAPTHNLGLPSPASRARAASGGGGAPASGIAEWLAARPPLSGRRVAAFDTAVPGPFSGSAAKRIARSARELGASVVARASFVVAGSPPALAPGEVKRAAAWGAGLLAP